MALATPTLYKIIASELYNSGFNHEIVDSEGNLTFFDDDFQIMPKILSYDDDIKKIVDRLFLGVKLDDPVHDLHFKKTFFYRFLNRGINRQTLESFQMELMNVFYTNESYINRVYKDMEKYITQTQESDSNAYSFSEQYNSQNNKENNTETDTQTNQENNKQNTTDNTTGNQTTDTRNASASLPQDNVNLNVNDTTMDTADNNDISRSKQTNTQGTTGETTGESTGQTEGNRTGERTGESEGYSNNESDSRNDSTTKYYRLEELFKTSTVLENIMNTFDRKCFLQTW